MSLNDREVSGAVSVLQSVHSAYARYLSVTDTQFFFFIEAWIFNLCIIEMHAYTDPALAYCSHLKNFRGMEQMTCAYNYK